MSKSAPDSETSQISIGMQSDVKLSDLINVAPETLGVDVTRFILDATFPNAEEIVVGRNLLMLSDEAFDRFEQALAANPISNNGRLKALLAAPKLWS